MINYFKKDFIFLKDIFLFFILAIVIGNSIAPIFFSFFQGFSEKMADTFIMAEQWVVHSVFVLVVFSVYKRNLIIDDFVISVILGYFLNQYGVLTHYFHYLLQNNTLYPKSFYSPSGTVNVQYGLLLPYFIFLVVLFLQILFTFTRTLSRSIVFVLALVAWITTTVFHIVFVQISLMETVENIQFQRKEQANIILQIDSLEDFNNECLENNYLCLRADKDDNFNLSRFSDFEKQVQGEINRRHEFFSSLGVQSHIISDNKKINLLSKDVSGNQYSLQVKKNSSRLIIDKMDYNPIVWQHKIYFSIYVGIAHIVWFLGAYWAIYFHKKRFKRLRVQ
jgi:hypothetical protein